MAIHHFVAGGTFGPEQIQAMTEAFDRSLSALNIADRKGPDAIVVASAIIDMAENDLRDPQAISDQVVATLQEARRRLASETRR
jgi:hypothetical protein